VSRISRSDGVVTVNVWLFAALPTTMMLLLRFHLLQVVLEPIEPLLPDVPVALGPISHFLERCRLDPAGPPLRLTPPGDEPGALEHAQMLRDRRHAHVEELGQFGDRTLA